MIWVRFSTGVSVRYNTANFICRREEYSDLYVDEAAAKANRGWVAQVPNSAIIEVVEACAVNHPLDTSNPRLSEIEKTLRSMKLELAALRKGK